MAFYRKRKLLLNELIVTLDNVKELRDLQSKLIEDLSFVLTWKSGVCIAIEATAHFYMQKIITKIFLSMLKSFLKTTYSDRLGQSSVVQSGSLQ
jgi:hypothetical protein